LVLNSLGGHAGGRCIVVVDNSQKNLNDTDIRKSVDGLGVDFYRTILQTQPVGTVVFDSSLRVVWCSPSAVSLTGGGLKDICGDLGRLCQAGQTVNWAGVLTEVVTFGQSAAFSAVQMTNSAGRSRSVDMLFMPLPGGLPGGVVGGLMVLIDVTNQLGPLARRLAISERMAALGRMAAKIAHELNNPLDGILRYISLAQRVADQGPDSQQKLTKYLVNAEQGLTRMSQILSELLDFSRGAGGKCQRQDIDGMIQQAISTVEPLAQAAGVAIVTSCHGSRPVGHSDLFQVFCNLAKNAIDAMDNSGRLMISTFIDGDFAVIRFEDTGPGLPAEAAQLFEPFFTTKPEGQGTGLGLAISKEIVEKCSGCISADNRPTGGAIFEVRVPKCDQSEAQKNDSDKDN